MDINIIYNKILERLKLSNQLDIFKNLENASIGASTGSEALMLIGSYLLSLKQNHIVVYKLIEEQIEEYLEYCKQNGLIII